jgi:hypothetical protein
MTSQTKLNSILALIALAALSLYVLACSTAFSPDDKKVLYPAFDPQSGAMGIAAYDRTSARSEMLFLPMTLKQGTNSEVDIEPWLMRPQWLNEGRNILIAWAGAGSGSDDDLNLAVLPVGAPATAPRLYCLPDMQDAVSTLVMPLPLVGNRLFLSCGSNTVVRLDVTTGMRARHTFAGVQGDVLLYASPKQDGVFYLEDRKAGEQGVVFGRMNPDTFALMPLMTITNDLADGGFFAYSDDGKRVVLAEKADGGLRLVVLEAGKPVLTRLLTSTNEDVKGDALIAGYTETPAGQTNSLVGLMEVPFSAAPVRRTVLIQTTKLKGEAAFLTQAAVSHDGKTAAVATTYLACDNEDFHPDDCALFLVDLSDPNRKVTKVAIQMPAKTSEPKAK